MPNTQIYRVFLLQGNTIENAVFLFSFKQDPKLRPSLGDVIIQPATFREFKILRDEAEDVPDLDLVTHDYFVTRANNSNRISSWSQSGFANDQTLKQLFR